jgi:hypothetical protein
MEALARLGELWLGIADRLPIEEEVIPFRFVPPPPTGDEETVTAVCRHSRTVWLNGGHWLHVTGDLAVCDDPPIKEPER